MITFVDWHKRTFYTRNERLNCNIFLGSFIFLLINEII